MIDLSFFLDILKFSISGVIIFFVGWFIIREYLAEASLKHSREVRKENLAQTLPLKLQAYERITLFLERLNPANMLVRLHVAGLSAREMQNVILADIRSEYQHNISQQIYVSDISWNVVRKMKDETIGMIHSAVSGLPDSASSIELSKVILSHFANLQEDNPYEVALQIVKREVQQTL
jgi:hypothetical protein